MYFEKKIVLVIKDDGKGFACKCMFPMRHGFGIIPVSDFSMMKERSLSVIRTIL